MLNETISNYIKKNLDLTLENKELTDDLEDMVKAYTEDIQEFKHIISTLEEKLDIACDNFANLQNIIVEQERELEFNRVYIDRLKEDYNALIEKQYEEYYVEVEESEKWLESPEADLLAQAYAEQGYIVD